MLIALPLTATALIAMGPPPSTDQNSIPSSVVVPAPMEVGDSNSAGQASLRAAEAAERAAQAANEAVQVLRQLLESNPKLAAKAPGDDSVDAGASEPSPWQMTLALSALAIGGNASSYNAKLDAGVDGRWRDWNTEFRLSTAYGQNGTEKGDPSLDVTASKGEITARGERLYNPIFGTYLKAGAAFDRVASVQWRVLGELGVSLLWWEVLENEVVKSRLRTSLGFSALREHRYTYYPIPGPLPPGQDYKNVFGPTFGLSARYAISKTSYFAEDAELLLDVMNSGDLRINSTTALVAQIRQALALSLGFTYQYVGSPPEGKGPNDYTLATGLAWTW